MSLQDWVEEITTDTLLELAPHGLFVGCGGTSEYLAYAVRSRPVTEKDLFEINRTCDYMDSSTHEAKFRVSDLHPALIEIDRRLDQDGYVRVSFEEDEDEEEKSSTDQGTLLKSIFNYTKTEAKAKLFDHSFLLLKTDKVYRLESYIAQYKPRIVEWESYRQDMINLFASPIDEWERLFSVKCLPDHNLAKVNIVLHS